MDHMAPVDRVKQSMERTEEDTRLKRKRDHARFRLKLGQRDAKQHRDTDLAKSFIAGTCRSRVYNEEARGRGAVLRESLAWVVFLNLPKSRLVVLLNLPGSSRRRPFAMVHCFVVPCLLIRIPSLPVVHRILP